MIMKIKNFSIKSGGNKLNGVILYHGTITPPARTVIISHGFASNMLITSPYAKPFLDAGYVVIMYDFCCSGSGISSGKSTQMSVISEKNNLIDVLDYACRLNFVDSSHITLCGCSQGGFVSALAAVECEDRIERLVMYYPALCIPDDARRGCIIGTKIDTKNVPDKFFALFIRLGKKYVDDAFSLDPYEQICSFKKPVLIIHGIEDKLVKIDYSRRADELYGNSRLIEVHGDHGFIMKGLRASCKATSEYLKKNDSSSV